MTLRQPSPRRARATVRARHALLVALAALVLAVVEAACGQAATARSSSGSGLSVKVGGASSAPAVAPGFLGISTEIKNLLVYAGSSTSNLDQPFLQLMRNLAPGSGPVLRIAGDSSDWSWWPVPGMKQPGGAKYALGPKWASVAAAVAKATRAKEIIGLNFEADSRTVAGYEAKQLMSHVGASAIDAFELGNEPELYSGFSWYKTASGASVYGRPRTYDMATYVGDWANVASGLSGLPVAGPSTGSANWLQDLSPFLSRNHSRLKLATVHAYPLRHCSKTTVNHPADLLASSSLQGLVNGLEPASRAAHRYHVPIRLDEINSVTCGGELGVTNSFAAALWALNLLPLVDRAGIVGVNFQTVPGTWQSMINATDSSAGWRVAVQPVYYGLATFAQAAPPGSRFLNLSAPSAPGMFEWAAKTPSGQVNVVLTNSSSSARTVTVTVPGQSAAGQLMLLRAPGIGSTSGVTLGGQSISPATGALAAAPSATPVPAGKGGTYSVKLPGSSAALLAVGGSAYTQP